MVNKEDHQPSIIFPPFNHEGFHNHQHVHEIDIEQAEPQSPVTPPGPTPHWWDVGVDVLRFKLVGIVSFIRRVYMNGGGVFGSYFKNVGVMVVVLLFYLRFRRSSRLRRESVGQLIRIIKEKDEKIHQLLYQIAKMNEILLTTHHGIAKVTSG